jgi:predicted AlkP superfamily phosphohydrolase/phosphomutase/Flp pilus assembly protein TadD
MRRHRFLQSVLLLFGIAAVIYLAISLFLPSQRRLTFGIDRQTGQIRLATSGVTFLPPHNYRRVSFVKREGTAVTSGLAQTASQEGIPIRIAYRIRFLVGHAPLPDARRIVIDGWDAWFDDRVAEAVRAFTGTVPVEDLTSPTAQFSRNREALREAVAGHLARSGIEVSAFQIENLSVDREALLQHKRQELRRRARGPVGRVAIFGIDGADWEVIDQFVKAGRMPNLQALIRSGAKARLQSVQPLVSPLVWATLSTGLPPARHGVVDFFERESPDRPVTSRTRNAPALWEITGAFGRGTVVVDWWTAWPPRREEPVVWNGSWGPAGAAVHPPELAEVVRRLVISSATVQHPQVSRFAEVGASQLQEGLQEGEDHPLRILQDVLVRTWTDHRVGLELYQRQQPFLFMIGFPGADAIHHTFGPYHPPGRANVDWEMRNRYWPVVTNYYMELDRLIGEWLQVITDDTTVIVVSAHGTRWDRGRPATPPGDRSDLGLHRDSGIFVIAGNRVRPSQAMRSLNLVDVTPTVLTILGLPGAKEMTGRYADEFFDELPPIEAVQITSYSDVVTLDRQPVTGGAQDPASYRTELVRIGHLTPQRAATEERVATGTPATLGEAWGEYAWLNNEGVRLTRENSLDEAVRAFEQAIRMNPDRPTPYVNLAKIALKRQRYTNADQLIWKAVDLGVTDPEDLILDLAAWYRSNDMPTRAIQVLSGARERYPDSYEITANLGSALAAAQRYTDAVPILEHALALRPTATVVLNNLGTIYAERKQFDRALDYWNRSLEISPRQPVIAQAARAAVTQL